MEMTLGILKNKIANEKICITPEAVSVLVQNNHTVLIEGDALSNKFKKYLNVGAYIIDTKEELLDRGDLVIKKSALDILETRYLSGNNKIVFTTLNLNDKDLIKKIIKSGVSVIDYMEIIGIKSGKVNIKDTVEFSNYILPFLLELSDMGLKALVDDEILRDALVIMNGKVYNNNIANILNVNVYEF